MADTVQRRIQRLRDVIRRGILTIDPYRGSRRVGPFFGSFDWHSAVHAHWALLTIAHTQADATLESWLRARLSDKALQGERDFLKGDGSFEQPYGRAWLLLLLTELSRGAPAPTAVTGFQRELEEALLTWLERSDYPEGGSVAAPRFEGQHHSWLFAYLLLALTTPKAAGVRDRMRALRRKKIEPARAQLATATPRPGDFLHLPAVQAVLDRVDATVTAKPAPYPIGASPPLLDPPLDKANAHNVGAALVRVWPHAIDGHGGNARACLRFHTRMDEFFSRTDQWADSFDLVAHWIPQFMWMGLWLERGRP